jgi:hypothetical protein
MFSFPRENTSLASPQVHRKKRSKDGLKREIKTESKTKHKTRHKTRHKTEIDKSLFHMLHWAQLISSVAPCFLICDYRSFYPLFPSPTSIILSPTAILRFFTATFRLKTGITPVLPLEIPFADRNISLFNRNVSLFNRNVSVADRKIPFSNGNIRARATRGRGCGQQYCGCPPQ